MSDLIHSGNFPPAAELVDEGDGGEPKWTSCFLFCGFIERAARIQVLNTITSSAIVYPESERPTITFGTRGFMDEVIALSAETVRPLLGRVITASLIQVNLISKSDALNNLAAEKPFKSYDVTLTALKILGITCYVTD